MTGVQTLHGLTPFFLYTPTTLARTPAAYRPSHLRVYIVVEHVLARCPDFGIFDMQPAQGLGAVGVEAENSRAHVKSDWR